MDIVVCSFITSVNLAKKKMLIRQNIVKPHQNVYQMMHSDTLNASIDSGNSSFGLVLLLLSTVAAPFYVMSHFNEDNESDFRSFGCSFIRLFRVHFILFSRDCVLVASL